MSGPVLNTNKIQKDGRVLRRIIWTVFLVTDIFLIIKYPILLTAKDFPYQLSLFWNISYFFFTTNILMAVSILFKVWFRKSKVLWFEVVLLVPGVLLLFLHFAVYVALFWIVSMITTQNASH